MSIATDFSTQTKQLISNLSSEHVSFSELDLCTETQKGLQRNKYQFMTDIQRQSLPVSLKGRDILACARTGSGKTLCFIIPILERLYSNNFRSADGLGALIISPTRELALQIFETLNLVGASHKLSAGLVVGKKSFKEESAHIHQMNIIVGTPGRILQHITETPGFYCDNLQILVLDEADRILDMGFQEQMNAILNALPKKKQVMLFSATQTKSVRTLGRLSLKMPAYIWASGDDDTPIPPQLIQRYVIINAEQKKTLVFFASCKQVAFVGEAFRLIRPGTPTLYLHGRMKQMKRFAVYERFKQIKEGVLLTTDIASRGLDIQGVDWVIQFDCPEDTNQYIHRVGRTARYTSGGKALIFLLPSEVPFVTQLLEKKVDINEIFIAEVNQSLIKSKLQTLLTKDPSLKDRAKKAIISYIRCLSLSPLHGHINQLYQKNKLKQQETNSMINNKGNEVIDDEFEDEGDYYLQSIDLDALADSMGLSSTPVISFIHLKNNDQINKQTNSKEEIIMPLNEDQEIDDNQMQKRKRKREDDNLEQGIGEGYEESDNESNDKNDDQNIAGFFGKSWIKSKVNQTSNMTLPRQLLSEEEKKKITEHEQKKLERRQQRKRLRLDRMQEHDLKKNENVSRYQIRQGQNNQDDEEVDNDLFSTSSQQIQQPNSQIKKTDNILSQSQQTSKIFLESVTKSKIKKTLKHAVTIGNPYNERIIFNQDDDNNNDTGNNSINVPEDHKIVVADINKRFKAVGAKLKSNTKETSKKEDTYVRTKHKKLKSQH
ncbi:MAG: putative ATP-dependent RNA helicase dbp-4 [Streblomastix strix]|uniref:ATP-dependent RNA helicase n=1 Tax=Streblomastix strix TaxID=222440 RepID=A0A5J4WUU2_9EUKA|nr:MAG: putative ATP-dependent RNA helicase dbp-4 [Streblomastix strix]